MKLQISILIFVLITACSTSTEKGTGQAEIHKNIKNESSTKEILGKIIGERIEGPADVRDKMNGKIILSLNDNVLVETAPQQGDWYLIGVSVKLSDNQIKESKINPNSDLYSFEGKIIGRTNDTLEVWVVNENEGHFEAFIHIDNIKKFTIPERALEKEIMKKNLAFSQLKNFIESFEFIENEENPELKYKQLFIYESRVIDPSPRDRISLLFDRNDSLIGIVHSRQIVLNGFKTFELVRGHALTFIAELDKSERKRIIDERINFYNSVD
jgi:hypothetical protein